MADPGGGETRSTISGGTQQGPVLMGRDFRDVHIGDITVTPPMPAPLAMRGLPADRPTFVGREAEVGELLRAWTPGAGAAVTVVSGLAGVGKTAVAIHAAHHAHTAGLFPGGVLFADLAGFDRTRHSDPALVLAQFLRALGVQPQHTPSNEAELRQLYLTLLAEQSMPILVFLDNVAAVQQAVPLVPGAHQHRTVVTSRNRLSAFAGARHLEVDVLDPTAAVAMLDGALRAADEQDSRITDDPAATRELATLCGHLPLALWIAAVLLIADPERPVSELVEALAEERERLSSLSYDSDLAVRAAFTLSYGNLDEEQARLFRMLGLHPGSDFSTEAAAAIADRPIRETTKLLSGLRQAYLLQPTPRRGRYRFHDLLRVYASELAANEVSERDREDAISRLLEGYLARTIAADQHMSSQVSADQPAGPFENWAASADWLDNERHNLAPLLRLAADSSRDLTLCEFGFFLFWYLYLRRHATDGIVIHGYALAAARRIPKLHYEIHSLINLGVSLAELGRFEEAAEYFKQGLDVSGRYTEHDHDVYLLNDLGSSYRQLGLLEEAVDCHERALRAGPDTRHEAILRHDLGLAFRDLGRLDEAADCHRRALTLFREVDDRHHEGETLTDLGLVLRDLRHDDAAISHQQAALAVYRQLGDRFFQAIVLSRLASALADLQQNFDESLEHLREARRTFAEFADQRREAQTLMLLARVLQQSGRETEAAEARREAQVISGL